MKKNIILVGFMGTGKSSVGRRLAQRLQMTFYDRVGPDDIILEMRESSFSI